MSKEFKSRAEAEGISIDEAPTEKPGLIGVVERHHAPLRSAFNKIQVTVGRSAANYDECLKLSVYPVNRVMGPEGLTYILLVFGALPRPAISTPSPTQLVRQTAVEKARKETSAEQAKRRLALAFKHPSIPKARNHRAHCTTCQQDPKSFCIERNRNGGRDRSITSPRMEKPLSSNYPEDAVYSEAQVLSRSSHRSLPPIAARNAMTKKTRTCRSTEPCTSAITSDTVEPNPAEKTARYQHGKKVRLMYKDGDDLGNEPRKVKFNKGSKEERMFARPRREELEGLMKNGTFKRRKKSKIPKGTGIFGT